MPVILTNRLRWFDSLYYDCAEAAEDDAAETVVATARQYGTPIIVWSNGEMIEIDPYTERRVQPKSGDDSNSELFDDANRAT